MSSFSVKPVPVRDDNYAYLIVDNTAKIAAAVDPYDVPKVSQAAKELGVKIVSVLTTHHHFDHAGGNQEFASANPGVPIYGGSDKVSALTNLVKDNDILTVGDNIHVKCLATPCHTQDSICYYVTDSKNADQPGSVFTGDTLFIGGCGRFFEGTSDEMISALSYLGQLPAGTITYTGHEYTAGNVAFAKTIEPENEDIGRLANLVKENKITQGLSTIADEKKWNVFMRLDNETVKKATGATDDSKVMAALREAKNNFRG